MFRHRTIIVGLLLTLGFALMAGRLWYLQVSSGEYYRKIGHKQLHRLIQVPPSRGRILDRRGRILAEDITCFDLWITPAKYVRIKGKRRIVSNLGELSPEKIIDIITSSGTEKELKIKLAHKYLSTRSELVEKLAAFLNDDSGKSDFTKDEIATRIIKAATSIKIKRKHSLTDRRLLLQDIPIKAAIAIYQENLLSGENSDIFGVSVYGGYKRVYPYKELMGHITGYTGNLSQKDYAILRGGWSDDDSLIEGAWEIKSGGREFFKIEEGSDEYEILKPYIVRKGGKNIHVKGYLRNERVGRAGIEQWYNQELRGQHVWKLERLVKLSPKSPRIFQRVSAKNEAINGSDIKLTLDVKFQQKVTEILDKELTRLSREPAHRSALRRHKLDKLTGAALVMNANNGEIYALVSLPSYDPNRIRKDYRKLLRDKSPRQPLQNRVIRGVISGGSPPGSTIKPLIALAALEEEKIKSGTEFLCEGVEMLGDKEYVCMNRAHHGDINVTDALKVSCNVFFYNAGKRLGSKKIAKWLTDLGAIGRTNIDLPNERTSKLSEKAFTGKKWSLGENYHISIGQGQIDSTPIHMATSYATLLNGGDKVRPHLRYNPMDPELNSPRARMRLSPSSIETVKRGMWKVIQWDEYPRGTATKYAKIPGFDYMGKTGSAQQNRRDTHAWMCAAAPYEKPEIIVAVLIPFANHGGSSCGPTVKKIVEAYFQLDEYEPENNSNEDDEYDENDGNEALG